MPKTDQEIDVALREKLRAYSQAIPAPPANEFEQILSKTRSQKFLSWKQLVPLSLGFATMGWLLVLDQSQHKQSIGQNFGTMEVSESEVDAFVLDSYSVAFIDVEDYLSSEL